MPSPQTPQSAAGSKARPQSKNAGASGGAGRLPPSNHQFWDDFVEQFGSNPDPLAWIAAVRGRQQQRSNPSFHLLEQELWAGIPDNRRRRAVWKIISADVPPFKWEEPNGPALDPALAADIQTELNAELLSPVMDPALVQDLLTKAGRILKVFGARNQALGGFEQSSASLLLHILQATQGDEAEAYAVFHRTMECLRVYTGPQHHSHHSQHIPQQLTAESKDRAPRHVSTASPPTAGDPPLALRDSQLHADTLMLAHFLVEDLPQLTQHLDRFRFDVADLLEIAQQWLGSLFAGHVQDAEFVLRAVDLVLFGFNRSLFGMAYGLIRARAPTILQQDDTDAVFESVASVGRPAAATPISGEQAPLSAVIKLALETGWLDLVGNPQRTGGPDNSLELLRRGKSWSNVCQGAGPVLFVPGVGSPGGALAALEAERTRRHETELQRIAYLEQLSPSDDGFAGPGSVSASSSASLLFCISESSSDLALAGGGGDAPPLTPVVRGRGASSEAGDIPLGGGGGLLTPAQQQKGSSATWSTRRPPGPNTPGGHQPSLSGLQEDHRRPSSGLSGAHSSGGTLSRGGGGLGARASRMGALFGGLYHRPGMSGSGFSTGGGGAASSALPDLEPLVNHLQGLLQFQSQPGNGGNNSSLGEQHRRMVQQALDSIWEFQHQQQQHPLSPSSSSAAVNFAASGGGGTIRGVHQLQAIAGAPGSGSPPTPHPPSASQQQQQQSISSTTPQQPLPSQSQPSSSSSSSLSKPRMPMVRMEAAADGGLLVQLPGPKARILPELKKQPAAPAEDGIVKHSALADYLSFPCLYMEGLLLKARGKKHNIGGIFGNKNLQLRFFVLQGRFLSYFRSKDARKPTKDISLDMRNRKILVLKHHEFGQNGFQINRANGVPALLLFADTPHIRDVWVNMLQCASQLPD